MCVLILIYSPHLLLFGETFFLCFTIKKGFDGPKRPSIEEGEVPIQTLQYGFRNDAWQAMDDLLSELDFGFTETIRTDDLSKLIDRVISAVDSYISLAPSSQLDEAFRLSIDKSI